MRHPTLLLAALTACGGEPTPDRPEDVRALDWEISTSPTLEIGRSLNNPDGQLFGAVAGATLSNGDIAIANAGSGEIGIYGEDGAFRRSLGDQGQGPGEFETISTFTVDESESVNVFDERQQRLTTFDRTGELSGTKTVPNGLGIGELYASSPGVWYAREYDRISRAPVGEVGRDTVAYLILEGELTQSRNLARVPGIATVSVSLPGGDAGTMSAPFSPRPVAAAYGKCLLVADSESWDIAMYSDSGELIHQIVNEWEPVPVTPAHRDAWSASLLAAVPEEAHSMVEATFTQIPTPEYLPAYNALIVDELGYIWLQRYAPLSGSGNEWLVYRPDGPVVGRVTTPEPFVIFEIGSDHILAKVETELDEELVRVYQLVRPDVDPVTFSPCIE